MKIVSYISARWPRLRPFLPIIVAACIGVGGSVFGWYVASVRDARLAELEFAARARSHASILQNGINEYLNRIAALRAFFEASSLVDRDEFGVFAERLMQDQKAILRVTWIPRVRGDERLAHEHEAIEDGLTSYRIHDLAADAKSARSPQRDEYFPVLYATGVGKTSDVFGLDVASEPARALTLARARDTGQMATAPAIALNTVSGSREGFFVVAPVYRRGAPHDTVEDRRKNLVGFVNGVFQVGAMIETILGTTAGPGDVELDFYSDDPGHGSVPFHIHGLRQGSTSAKAQAPGGLSAQPQWSQEIKVGDARWVLVAAPIAGGTGSAGSGRAWIALIAGLLVTGLMVAYMWASIRYARNLEEANEALDSTLGELEAQNTRFDAALNNMSEGLCLFDAQQRLVVSNSRYAQMYDMRPDQVRPGTTLREILNNRVNDGVYAGQKAEDYLQMLFAMVSQSKPVTQLQELNDGRIIALKYQPLPDGGWVSTHEDVTEQRRTQDRMAYMAHHDALTGLANRTTVRERLQAAVAGASREEGMAVLCLDLDRFKEVNDTLGHPIGDGLLQAVAERLRGCVHETDTVARLGGDEFAVVQIGSNQPMDATALATRIIDAINLPYDLEGHEVVLGTSIGIAVAPTDGTDPDELMRNADLALYKAKNDGRGTHRFFEKGMDERMQARRNLERDLRKALGNGEFEIHYQPLVDLQRSEITGFEALLRWNHPQRGAIAPADFIPLAEDTGLIVPIGAWVLQQACMQAASWPDHIKVAVNLSSAQFKSQHLVTTVFGALCASGLAKGRLELEITESVLLKDSVRTRAMLHELRELGARISMDDFGTGYSSLSYLQSFPFDKIKIDQSFIRNINENIQSLAIVHAVAGLGVSLGMATTAEGVETEEQLDRVRAEGCTEAQGYYFSPPRPASQLGQLLLEMARKSDLAA